MRRLFAVGIKDVRITARDRSALMILLAMPAVLILILNMAFGGISSGGGSAVPSAVVNHDRGSVGAQIAKGFESSAEIKKIAKVTVVTDEAAARRQVEAGDLAGLLVIPADFTAKIESATPVSVTVYGDPGQPVSAAIFAGIADSIGTRVSAASIAGQTTSQLIHESKMVSTPQQAAGLIQTAVKNASETNALEGVQVKMIGQKKSEEISFNALDYYAAAQTAMFLIFGAMFGAFSFIRERRQQTLARLLTTPAGRGEIVGGKLTGVWAIGLLQFAVLFGFTSILGANWGATGGAILVAGAEAFAAAGLAMTFAAIGRTERAVGAIGPIVTIIMGAAGGSMIPVFQMPAWLRPVHFVSINGWAMDAFFKLQNGASTQQILPYVGVLLALGVLFAGVGAWRLRWE